jgi:hypothetical protein
MLGDAGWRPSDSTQQHENDDDQKNQAESAARVVSPSGAVRPARQSTDEKKNENDDQDCAHGTPSLSYVRSSRSAGISSLCRNFYSSPHQTQNTYDDQINGDDIIEQPGNNQNQNARD